MNILSAILERGNFDNGFSININSRIPLAWMKPDANKYSKSVHLKFSITESFNESPKFGGNTGGYIHSNGIMYDNLHQYLVCQVALSKQTAQPAHGILKTNEVKTDYLRSQFGRMFYLRSVTINTLGYGDIVPVTGFTIFLVGFQSVAGIILIGLFLASITGGASQRGQLCNMSCAI